MNICIIAGLRPDDYELLLRLDKVERIWEKVVICSGKIQDFMGFHSEYHEDMLANTGHRCWSLQQRYFSRFG